MCENARAETDSKGARDGKEKRQKKKRLGPFEEKKQTMTSPGPSKENGYSRHTGQRGGEVRKGWPSRKWEENQTRKSQKSF